MFSKPIFITGLPRTGTSLMAGILAEHGVFTGDTISPSIDNAKGFFEHKNIREKVIKPILSINGFDPLGVKKLPPIGFSPKVANKSGQDLRQIFYKLLKADGYKNDSIWAYKDAKILLMWRMFHEAFPEANWIITKRSTKGFIDSCLRTSFMSQHSTDTEFWGSYSIEMNSRINDLHRELSSVFFVNIDSVIAGDYSQLKEVLDGCKIEFSEKLVESFVTPPLYGNQNKHAA